MLIRTVEPVNFRPEPVQVAWWLTAPLWLARRLWRLARIVIRSPAALIVIATMGGSIVVWQMAHPIVLWVAFVLSACGSLFWALQFPDSWRRLAAGKTRGIARSLFIYRPRWGKVMKACGMVHPESGTTPLLLKVSSTGYMDRLRLRMLPGQQVEDYAKASERLAQTFGVPDCRIRSLPSRPQDLELGLLVNDPFKNETELASVDLTKPPGTQMCLATTEDGKPWRFTLPGTHLLVAGESGSGKGSVIWGLIRHLTPSIEAGLVSLWVIDPKGGMELAAGRHMFDQFAYRSETQYAALLEAAVKEMNRRADAMRGVARSHTPTVEEPLMVIIIDEIASLTAWGSNRTIRTRITKALSLLLSKGRAVGVAVVGAVQIPNKDILPVRDLFKTRIALRLTDPGQVDMVLGEKARENGALCDKIPESLPGVGYVQTEGLMQPTRIRFGYITDAMIKELGRNRPQVELLDEPTERPAVLLGVPAPTGSFPAPEKWPD